MGKFKELASLLVEPTDTPSFNHESVFEKQVISNGIVPQLISLSKRSFIKKS